MTGKEVIELIETTCDTDCELYIQVYVDGKKLFFRPFRTDEAFLPEDSQYAAVLVGTDTLEGEIF